MANANNTPPASLGSCHDPFNGRKTIALRFAEERYEIRADNPLLKLIAGYNSDYRWDTNEDQEELGRIIALAPQVYHLLDQAEVILFEHYDGLTTEQRRIYNDIAGTTSMIREPEIHEW